MARGSFATYNNEALETASKRLTQKAFELWLYALRNKAGFRFDLSYADFSKHFDVSERSYRDIKRELKEKGYMEPKGKNIFIMHEFPLDEKDRKEVAFYDEIEPFTPMSAEEVEDEDIEIIDSYAFSHLADGYEDLGNGRIRLRNGKICQRVLTALDF